MSDQTSYPSKPWRQLLALALTGASLVWFTSLWKRHATPLEAAYLSSYIRVSIAPHLPLKWTVITHDGMLALPSDEGVLVRQEVETKPPDFESYLRNRIYRGKPIWLFSPVLGALAVLLLSMGIALKFSNRANHEARNGRLLRGPELVSQRRFNGSLLWKRRNRGFYIEAK
jgi:hypothetical protein